MEDFFGRLADYFENNPIQLTGGIFVIVIAILTIVLPKHIMVKFTKPAKVTSSRVAGGLFLVLMTAFLIAVGIGKI